MEYDSYIHNYLSNQFLGTSQKFPSVLNLTFRKIQDLRIEKPEILSMRDFLLIIQSGLFRPLDLKDWLDQVNKLYLELKDKRVENKRRSRLRYNNSKIKT